MENTCQLINVRELIERMEQRKEYEIPKDGYFNAGVDACIDILREVSGATQRKE